MAQQKYAAFAGVHIVHARKRRQIFTVMWWGKDLLACVNVGTPPGHADRMKVGWYWRGAGAEGAQAGPFTSSRKAYQDARLRCRKQ
jgi:hypothetical protein